jgi:ABC-type nitrate/sulfonate/bicarbonate transport system permease component
MDATLWQHLAASLTRIVVALLAAVLIGVPVGIAMGLSPTVRGILDPLIELYRPVPPLAYLPLMVIWFGIGETSKILLIYLAIFAPVAMSALAGVKSAQQVRFAPRSRWAPAGRRCCVRDFTRRAAGDFNRAAHRARRGLVNAGGR